MNVGKQKTSQLEGPEEIALGRHNANGSLDTTFGTSGKTTMSIHVQGLMMRLQVLPDGQITGVGLAAGRSGKGLLGFPGTFGNFGVAEWGEEDPVGYIGGASFYQFVGGSPLVFSDPLGADKIANGAATMPTTGPTTQPGGFSLPSGKPTNSTTKYSVTLNDGGTGTLTVHVANYNLGQFFESGYLGVAFEATGCKNGDYQWRSKLKITIVDSGNMTPQQLRNAQGTEQDEHLGNWPFSAPVLDNGNETLPWYGGRGKKEFPRQFALPILSANGLDGGWFRPGTAPWVGFQDAPSLPTGNDHWGTGATIQKDFTLELFRGSETTGVIVRWSFVGKAGANEADFTNPPTQTSISISGQVQAGAVSVTP